MRAMVVNGFRWEDKTRENLSQRARRDKGLETATQALCFAVQEQTIIRRSWREWEV